MTMMNQMHMLIIIGASLSEPQTYDEYAATVCMCIYNYIVDVRVASRNRRLAH